jgi:hypothetical protein
MKLYSTLLFSLLLAWFKPADCGSKIDTIFFQNGDQITGEVKSLENNQLRISTDDAGTIKIEWSKIDSVKILNNMRILLEDGQILYGKILPGVSGGDCAIWHRDGDPVETGLSRIVSLSTLDEAWAKRLDGFLSSGFSYVKASEVMQVDLSGSFAYTSEKNWLELSYDGILTRDPESGNTESQNGGVTFQRLFPKKWFLVSRVLAESNSELKLDLRTSFALGGGNNLIQSNHMRFYLAGGLQFSREDSDTTNQYNAEGMLISNFSIFIYDAPEISFNLGASLIPSISDPGRIRTDINSNLKWEIISDLYLKWTFYYRFDSRPLSADAEKNDWAISLLGVEYSF